MTEVESAEETAADPDLTEGSLRPEPGYAREFDELVRELDGAVRGCPDRLRRPDAYVTDATAALDWDAIRRGESGSLGPLFSHFAVEFGDPDISARLALEDPEEHPFDPGDLRKACRAILDLEAVARTAGEDELAERALDLAARYADFYRIPVGGRTLHKQRELGLVRGEY